MWNYTTCEMCNYTNATREQASDTRPYNITLVTSLTVVAALTLSANIVLIITLITLKSKHLKQSTRLFLIYKCLGHAFQGLGVMAKPHLLNSQCVYFGRSIRFALGMTVSGMLLLSLDSFITITKPYHHKFIMTPRVAKLSIFILSMCVILLQIITALVPGPLFKSPEFCTQNNSQIDPWLLLIHILITIVFIFVSMGLQGYNIWTLRKRSKNAPSVSPIAFVPNAVGPMDTQPQKSTIKKVTRLDRLQRLLTFWVISLFVCWMPSCTMIGLRAIQDIYLIETSFIQLVQPQLSALTLLDGVSQPCLAVALSTEMRSGVRKLFGCGRCMKPDNKSTVANGGGHI